MDTVTALPPVLDSRKEYLESHSTGLGGTDISAVFNLSRWKAPIDVFLGKLGRSEPRDVTEPMYFGNEMEAVIRKAYEHRTKWRVATGDQIAGMYPKTRRWNNQTMVIHPEVDCILGTPDGIVPDANRGFEAKNVSFKGPEWGKAGSDEVPVDYLLQSQTYMVVTGLPLWDIAPLFHGSKLEIFTIPADRTIQDRILNGGLWWWNEHIVKRVPPAVDGSETYKRYLADLHKIGRPDYLNPTAEIDGLGYDLRNVQTERKALEAREDFLKNQLMSLIGDAAGAHLSDGDRIQWIRSKPGEVTDWEALAKSFDPSSEEIAAYTKEFQRSAYVRLYAGKKGGK